MASRNGHGQPGASRSAIPPARATSRAASSTSASSRARSAAPSDQPLASQFARRPPASTASSSDSHALRRARPGAGRAASTARTTSHHAASEAETETDVDVDMEDGDECMEAETEEAEESNDASSESFIIKDPELEKANEKLQEMSQEIRELLANEQGEHNESPEDCDYEFYGNSEAGRRRARQKLIAMYRTHQRAQEVDTAGEDSEITRCPRACKFCWVPNKTKKDLLAALHAELGEKVDAMDDDKWMFEHWKPGMGYYIGQGTVLLKDARD